MNSKASIEFIINNRCSISRFGDGEFYILVGRNGNTFQIADANLAARLRHILMTDDAPDHMICIPYPFKGTSVLRPLSRFFWGGILLQQYRFFITFIL